MSAERTCYVCRDPRQETRPYGEGGKPICLSCMKADPKREATAQREIASRLGAGPAVLAGELGPLPLSLPRRRGRAS